MENTKQAIILLLQGIRLDLQWNVINPDDSDPLEVAQLDMLQHIIAGLKIWLRV